MGLNLEYSSGQTPIHADEIDGLKINTIINQGELNEFEQLNIEQADLNNYTPLIVFARSF